MKKQLIAISIIILVSALSACGQTGPLYLPDEDKANSGSTLAKSGSNISNKDQQNNSISMDDRTSDSSRNVDNDPTPPAPNK